MGFAYVAWSALAAVAGGLLSLVGGPAHFSPNACASVSAALPRMIVGQPAALAAIADAVCDHLAENAAAGGGRKQGEEEGEVVVGTKKPLVLSAHGPPGVGKSAAHAVLAAALYSPADLSVVLEGYRDADENEGEDDEREDDGGQKRRRRRRRRKPLAPGSLLADCPGKGCPGYRVLFGLDYSDSARSGALAALRESLLEHVAKHPQSLIVVEEYDKLDCDARGLIRQLFGTSGAAAGVVTEDKRKKKLNDVGASFSSSSSSADDNTDSSSASRLTTAVAPSLAQSIILLESNAGYAQLHELLEQEQLKIASVEEEVEKKRKRGGGIGSSREATKPESEAKKEVKQEQGDPDAARLAVPLETAARSLKDLVFARWVSQRCEPRADSARALAAVDHFLPFYPLERPHLERLLRRRLSSRSLRARREDSLALSEPFDDDVVSFLAERADFDGRYPVEGGKEASALVTRYVTRALSDARRARKERAEALAEAERALAEAAAAAAAAAAEAEGAEVGGGKPSPPPLPRPQRLRIPPATGRLAVSTDGKRLEVLLFDDVDEDNRGDEKGTTAATRKRTSRSSSSAAEL